MKSKIIFARENDKTKTLIYTYRVSSKKDGMVCAGYDMSLVYIRDQSINVGFDIDKRASRAYRLHQGKM